jgi:hypothetical protein
MEMAKVRETLPASGAKKVHFFLTYTKKKQKEHNCHFETEPWQQNFH